MKKSCLLLLIPLLLSFYPAGAGTASTDMAPEVPPQSTGERFDKEKNDFASTELIIKFKEGTSEQARKKALQSIRAKEKESLAQAGFSLIQVPKGTSLQKAAKELHHLSNVEFVEPNYRAEAAFTPSDPDFKKQWYLQKLNTAKAWDASKGSRKITVAVIDGGVQINHPDLAGKIVAPYDMVSRRTKITPDMHGTHVAGIIAASSNKLGGSGVAPNVKIMPINVFSGNDAEMYDIADAIIYAADRNANIINLSLGTPSYSYIVDYAVQYAWKKGALIVAASGNESTKEITYPASLKNVLGISATDSQDRLAYYSNYGSYIDFAAPGDRIFSTVPGGSFGYMSGTSMATPVVSGTAALILSKNPFFSQAQIINTLKKSAIDLGKKGWDRYYGYGRIDIGAALGKTPEAISSIKQSLPRFSIDGDLKDNISFALAKGVTYSVYIQNSRGSIVRKIATKKKSGGGIVSTAWDGRLSNGKYAAAGTYKLMVKASNGKQTASKGATIIATNNVLPAIKANANALFSPPVKKTLSAPYSINKKVYMTSSIRDARNREVRRLLTSRLQTSGTHKIIWDGKDEKGRFVKDGKYTLVFSAADSAKRKATRKMTLTVDTKAPTAIVTPAKSPFRQDGRKKFAFTANIKENATASAYIMTGNETVVKTLTLKKPLKTGTIAFQWDGNDHRGRKAMEGSYYYKLELTDAAGNRSTIKSKTFNLVAPPVLASETASGFNTITYRTNRAGTVTMEIFNEGQTVLTQKNEMEAGNQVFTVNPESLEDGEYSYTITLEDSYSFVESSSGTITILKGAPVTP
ncbi:S8 family serine peptidase [Bacillus massilinigeriensis]|uniref:S8 family serine peptidase n=1 Tax=Bacillus mediterraneensis TaxID=1805474 RepID=UPI0008F808BD|nr:S8 family serine peptidase [Bacillus mediterraneensis]